MSVDNEVQNVRVEGAATTPLIWAWMAPKYERPDWTWEQCLEDFKATNPQAVIYDTKPETRELLIYFGGSTTLESPSPLTTIPPGWEPKEDPRIRKLGNAKVLVCECKTGEYTLLGLKCLEGEVAAKEKGADGELLLTEGGLIEVELAPGTVVVCRSGDESIEVVG